MKKKIVFLLLTVVMLCALSFPVLADDYAQFVYDDAGLLTQEERDALQSSAELLAARYTCGVYIVTLDDFTSYTADNTIDAAAKTLYRANAFGVGGGSDGIMICLSMAERDYALVAYGSFANSAFTDYGRESLEDVFLDDFGDDDWYAGFSDYYERCGKLLEYADAGAPYDVGERHEAEERYDAGVFEIILFSFIPAFIIALVVCLILRASSKSVRAKLEAAEYLSADSLSFTNRTDQFTHITETRVKIEKNQSSGGTTVDSGGFSSSSGKF